MGRDGGPSWRTKAGDVTFCAPLVARPKSMLVAVAPVAPLVCSCRTSWFARSQKPPRICSRAASSPLVYSAYSTYTIVHTQYRPRTCSRAALAPKKRAERSAGCPKACASEHRTCVVILVRNEGLPRPDKHIMWYSWYEIRRRRRSCRKANA